MSKLHNLYVGRSGQLATMAEFLIRGYNTAMPEVDRGDDIFVVEDNIRCGGQSLQAYRNDWSHWPPIAH